MNEKQIEEKDEQIQEKKKSYSLDGNTDQTLDQESDTVEPNMQKHILLAVAAVGILIIGFFVVQTFSVDTTGEPVAQIDQDDAVEETVSYAYIKVVSDEVIGEYLTDISSGRTLYTVDVENCPTQCIKRWTPYAGVEEVSLPSITSEFVSEGEYYHYAWNGQRLYYSTRDSLPGDVLGAGYYQVGTIARP